MDVSTCVIVTRKVVSPVPNDRATLLDSRVSKQRTTVSSDPGCPMRPRPNAALRTSTALLFVCGLLVLCASRAGAQSTDSTHWSIFAGRTTSSAAGADRSFNFPSENFGVGGSVEFKPSLFSVPLRATLSYDKFRGGPTTTLKATSLMVDAVFRPLPAVWGIRPYLLGGLGIATGVAIGHAGGGGRRRAARHPHCAHNGTGDGHGHRARVPALLRGIPAFTIRRAWRSHAVAYTDPPGIPVLAPHERDPVARAG